MGRSKIRESDFPGILKREYPHDKAWKGFFKLWLDAKGFDYGMHDEHIVDGAGDGGIDAIAYPPRGDRSLRVVVIQSKYFHGAIPVNALRKFFRAVAIFRSGRKAEFENWLEKVRGSLRSKYKELWRERNRIDFVLVTSGQLKRKVFREAARLKIHVENKKSVRALFVDMVSGKTPRPERITLHRTGAILSIATTNPNHRLSVFSTPVADFARAYLDHKKDLFAGNVRYALRNATAKDVRNGIADTLKYSPEDFVMLHNGITLVCKKMEKYGRRIRLLSPSIVNGAQTVTFVGEKAREVSKRANVLVKIIEVRSDSSFGEFETEVAMSSNTQNKVSLSDLSVVDPGLVSLERYFRARGCFLVRKKGDIPSGNMEIRIDKDRLLQLFACLDNRIGPAATKDKRNLYKYHAAQLFSRYADTTQSRKDAVFIATLDKFVRESLREFKLEGKRGKRKKRRLSLSYFTIFTVTAKLIDDQRAWNAIRAAFDADGRWRNEYATALFRMVKKVASAVLALARKDPDRNDTAFFKNREKVTEAIAALRKKLRRRVDFRMS